MTFLNDYTREGKGSFFKYGLIGLLSAGFVGSYFLLGNSQAKNDLPIQQENVAALDDLINSYQPESITAETSNNEIADLLYSWRILPEEERYNTIKSMIKEESKINFHKIRDVVEDHLWQISLIFTRVGSY